MIVGCLPPLGGGIRSLAHTGQHHRLLGYYFPAYLQRFERIHYFSYYDELLADYACAEDVASQVTLLPNTGPFGRRAYSPALAFQQRRYLKQCHVVRVFQATGVFPAVVARHLYGVPFVSTYGYRYSEFARAAGAEGWKVLLHGWLERLALRFADAIIVTTHELRAYVQQFVPRSRIHYIPNGVDTATFKPRGDCQMTDRARVFVFVGRLEPQKDLPTVLKAIARLQDQENQPVRLRLVGDGTLRSTLIAQAESLGIDVEFAGFVSHHHLPQRLSDADAFILASLHEGHPKALVEAMSCGLPCVVSDCNGNRALVTDGQTGLVFPIGDVESLVSQLERVLSQPSLARELGHKARRFVKESFDINALLERETELLAELASRCAGQHP